jgi:hypothetical protein
MAVPFWIALAMATPSSVTVISWIAHWSSAGRFNLSWSKDKVDIFWIGILAFLRTPDPW